MHGRMHHDCAFTIARRVLELVSGLLREEEHRDFVDEVYLIARQELKQYDEQLARQKARLRPIPQTRAANCPQEGKKRTP
jgi:hypothetical protein